MASGEGFSIIIVIGGPELFRRDRRQQYIIANGRRIQDFSFMQALEYGVEGWFPNGTHPVGAVYLEIDPSLADFNIHPAKREARFKDAGAIHHLITSSLRNFMHHCGIHSRSAAENQISSQNTEFKFDVTKSNSDISKSLMEAFLKKKENFIDPPRKVLQDYTESAAETASYHASTIKYRGRIFDLFIVVEKDNTLYIIDQHAAHERILFNRFIEGPIAKQELLAPIPFDTDSEDDDNFLESKREILSALGLIITKGVSHSWQIEALPAAWKLNDQKTVEEIVSLRTSHEDVGRKWAATLACHAAIKDGDYLDENAALALAEEALALSDPHCPHGRPIWTEINLESLLKAVKRI
jgi:DNA mismatch repair protein MutL